MHPAPIKNSLLTHNALKNQYYTSYNYFMIHLLFIKIDLELKLCILFLIKLYKRGFSTKQISYTDNLIRFSDSAIHIQTYYRHSLNS